MARGGRHPRPRSPRTCSSCAPAAPSRSSPCARSHGRAPTFWESCSIGAGRTIGGAGSSRRDPERRQAQRRSPAPQPTWTRGGFALASLAPADAGRAVAALEDGHPHQCRHGHRWAHTGSLAASCTLPIAGSDAEGSGAVEAAACPLCAERETLRLQERHEHQCELCDASWSHPGSCAAPVIATCPWCVPVPHEELATGASRGRHRHGSPCGHGWRHHRPCVRPAATNLLRCPVCVRQRHLTQLGHGAVAAMALVAVIWSVTWLPRSVEQAARWTWPSGAVSQAFRGWPSRPAPPAIEPLGNVSSEGAPSTASRQDAPTDSPSVAGRPEDTVAPAGSDGPSRVAGVGTEEPGRGRRFRVARRSRGALRAIGVRHPSSRRARPRPRFHRSRHQAHRTAPSCHRPAPTGSAPRRPGWRRRHRRRPWRRPRRVRDRTEDARRQRRQGRARRAASRRLSRSDRLTQARRPQIRPPRPRDRAKRLRVPCSSNARRRRPHRRHPRPAHRSSRAPQRARATARARPRFRRHWRPLGTVDRRRESRARV